MITNVLLFVVGTLMFFPAVYAASWVAGYRAIAQHRYPQLTTVSNWSGTPLLLAGISCVLLGGFAVALGAGLIVGALLAFGMAVG